MEAILRIRRNERRWLWRIIWLVNKQGSLLWGRVVPLFKTRKTLDVFILKILGRRREDRFFKKLNEFTIFGKTSS